MELQWHYSGTSVERRSDTGHQAPTAVGNATLSPASTDQRVDSAIRTWSALTTLTA
eukprot:CAMPEP_0182608534 /NCGR_PEP_ID=MMETSP1330-20130603/2926_1 /TAXON_ID=464278 /ORGANISM="Picochlorum sp., Strain RCC944" /LENGTH=55 /DNA_ID=CAMNT_0024827295 /DNA_START=121 /DNA_END=284 /DNA_ORIENTATION=-